MLGHRYPSRKPAGFRWRLLLAGECLRQPARIYESLPLRCALCGSEMRVIAFVIDVPAVSTILAHLGEPTAAPEVAPASGPPLWGQAARSHWDDTPAPAPSVRV